MDRINIVKINEVLGFLQQRTQQLSVLLIICKRTTGTFSISRESVASL